MTIIAFSGLERNLTNQNFRGILGNGDQEYHDFYLFFKPQMN